MSIWIYNQSGAALTLKELSVPDDNDQVADLTSVNLSLQNSEEEIMDCLANGELASTWASNGIVVSKTNSYSRTETAPSPTDPGLALSPTALGGGPPDYGTSFPLSPSVGQKFTRTDIPQPNIFYFNGTRWLTPIQTTSLSRSGSAVTGNKYFRMPGYAIMNSNQGYYHNRSIVVRGYKLSYGNGSVLTGGTSILRLRIHDPSAATTSTLDNQTFTPSLSTRTVIENLDLVIPANRIWALQLRAGSESYDNPSIEVLWAYLEI